MGAERVRDRHVKLITNKTTTTNTKDNNRKTPTFVRFDVFDFSLIIIQFCLRMYLVMVRGVIVQNVESQHILN